MDETKHYENGFRAGHGAGYVEAGKYYNRVINALTIACAIQGTGLLLVAVVLLWSAT